MSYDPYTQWLMSEKELYTYVVEEKYKYILYQLAKYVTELTRRGTYEQFHRDVSNLYLPLPINNTL